MKYLKFHIPIVFFVCIFIITACEDGEIYYNKNGTPYPKGVIVIDLDSSNDCTLESCDEQRLTRLVLENVRGIISSDSSIIATLTFDSVLEFTICGNRLSDFQPGDIVSISGECKDGCGYLQNGFPIEERYYLFITKIEKL